jgi:hypothetical protein
VLIVDIYIHEEEDVRFLLSLIQLGTYLLYSGVIDFFIII